MSWARSGDATREAGYKPNRFTEAYEDTHLLDKYAQFTQELGRLPVKGDLRQKARNYPELPSDNTFARCGRKSHLAQRLAEYCRNQNAYRDVILICEDYIGAGHRPDDTEEETSGLVYLMKSGRFWTIGKSNSAGRREYELAIQLPEKLELVHAIHTDDPSGIEEYWHKRFAAKRQNGEWFALTAAEVKAFKRREFM